jgi:hypothetical protein
MQNEAIIRISDFIYKQPEVVVAILKESGYDISVDTATLRQINELTFKALLAEEEPFTSKFISIYDKGEYLNIEPISLSVMAGVSLVSSLIGGGQAKKMAEKQRDAQKAMFLSNQSHQEKLKREELLLMGEIERTRIFTNSITDYRKALQEQGTKRLKDTWIFVVGAGLGISLIYGVYLFAKQN